MTHLPVPAPVEQVATAVGEVAVRRTPTRGPGPHEPAILIHGLEGNALNWVDLADALADRLDCVAVDLPGFGSSAPASGGDYSIAAHARAAAAVARELFPATPVHVLGNSMGGAVAVELAAHNPELVRTLCLISPALPSLRPRPANAHLPVMAIPRVGEAMYARYRRVGVGQRVDASYGVCFADPARLAPQRRAETEAEVARRDALPWVREAFISSVRGLLATFVDRSRERPWTLAGRITAPTLVIYGRRDRLVDSRASRRVTTAFPNAHVVVIRDAGHLAQVEQPALVEQAWRELQASAVT